MACDMGIDMSRYFLVRWQGSSDTDWVPWSGFYPTLILSKLCHGSFGDIEMSVLVILELMSTVCPSGPLGAPRLLLGWRRHIPTNIYTNLPFLQQDDNIFGNV